MKSLCWLSVLLLGTMLLVTFAPTASAESKKHKYGSTNGYYTTRRGGYNTSRAQNGLANGLSALLNGNGSYGATSYSRSRAPSYTSYGRSGRRSRAANSVYYPTTTRSRKKYYYTGH